MSVAAPSPLRYLNIYESSSRRRVNGIKGISSGEEGEDDVYIMLPKTISMVKGSYPVDCW